MAAAAAALHGQESLSTVKVYTKPSGVPFRVDGAVYLGPASFIWPAGSKHTLSIDTVIQEAGSGTRLTFGGWTTTGETAVLPNSGTVTVTADPAQTFYRADLRLEYSLDIRFFACGEGPCLVPGKIMAGSSEYTQDTRVWVADGGKMILQAVPAPGFVFVGWQDSAGNTTQGFINTVTVTRQTLVYARFAPARGMQLATSPPGLQLFIDRTPVATPQTLDWGYDTVHTVAPISPQADRQGRQWVFQSWSDGGASTHAYKITAAVTPDSLTATFVPGAMYTFLTSPVGLKLTVDGRDNWLGLYNFTWGVGESHHTEAAAEQTDAKGRRYIFKGWSNGSAAPRQDLVVTDADAASGVRMIAVYEALGRLSVESSVAGLTVNVDGAECRTPCVLDRAAGAEVRIAAPATVPSGDDSRYLFQAWNDAGNAPARVFTFSGDAVRLEASYRLTNRLVASADPSQGARWQYDPESPDGFYDAQSQVAVRVEALPGYRFRRMEGDLAGAFAAGTVTMSSPRYIRAVLDKVPYIAASGVRNAAGETPVAAVAPGSVVAIVGASLASAEETGPDSPLAQTLAGVTVRLGDRMLPLFYASPELITVQLPSDVELGPQNLAVKSDGLPEVRADFVVARNAPGLFQTISSEGNLAVAAHPDGSAVSVASPAKRGETVTLYGTGFGPCDRRPPDGFALPAAPAFTLADPLEIVAGDTTVQPAWAGAVPGRVGVQAVRLLVGPELPSGTAKLLVRVNGQESNTVLLPVEPLTGGQAPGDSSGKLE